MQRKFYKTEFKIVVLSEEPIADINLEVMGNEVTTGDCVLSVFECVKQKTMTPKQAVKALYDAGSEPGFFQLGENE